MEDELSFVSFRVCSSSYACISSTSVCMGKCLCMVYILEFMQFRRDIHFLRCLAQIYFHKLQTGLLIIFIVLVWEISIWSILRTSQEVLTPSFVGMGCQQFCRVNAVEERVCVTIVCLECHLSISISNVIIILSEVKIYQGMTWMANYTIDSKVNTQTAIHLATLKTATYIFPT